MYIFLFDMLSFYFLIFISLGKIKIFLIILRKVYMCVYKLLVYEYLITDDLYLNFLLGILYTC